MLVQYKNMVISWAKNGITNYLCNYFRNILIKIIGFLHDRRQWRPITAFQACQQNNEQIKVAHIVHLDLQSVCKAMKKQWRIQTAIGSMFTYGAEVASDCKQEAKIWFSKPPEQAAYDHNLWPQHSYSGGQLIVQQIEFSGTDWDGDNQDQGLFPSAPGEEEAPSGMPCTLGHSCREDREAAKQNGATLLTPHQEIQGNTLKTLI